MTPLMFNPGNWRAAVLIKIVVIALIAVLFVLRWSPEPAAAVVTAGNGIYDVAVEDSGAGLGQYTARTGASHPVTIATGANQNVLYRGDDLSPGTTFNTIRSYTTDTDYENDNGLPSSSFTVVALDPYGSVAPLGTTGFRTTYVLPGGTTTPDALTIVQDVRVNGTTFDDSTIEVTTTVTNDGDASVDIGIRYLWDFQIACDDGPTFTQISPDGSPLTTEQTFSPPTFLAYRIEDNDCTGSPTFAVFGTTTGPGTISPAPTPPDELQNTEWPSSVDTAFDYTTTGISTDDDNAVLYYWGPTAGSAMTLAPGGSVTVSASLFAAEPGEPPPIFETPTVTPTPAATNTPGPTPTNTPVPPPPPPEEEIPIGVRSLPPKTPIPTRTPVPPPPPTPTATAVIGAAPVILPPGTGSGGYLDGRRSAAPPWVAVAGAALGTLALGPALYTLHGRAMARRR